MSSRTATSVTSASTSEAVARAGPHRSWLPFRRVSLATALALSFGLMLVIGLGSVLALNLYANVANTRTLLAERNNLLLDTLSERLTAFFYPVEGQLAFVAAGLTSGDLELPSHGAERRIMRSLMGPTSQLGGLAFVRPDLSAWRLVRGRGIMAVEDWSGNATVQRAVDEARRVDAVRWGGAVWSPALQETVISARLPVKRDGEFLGLLVGTVSVDRFIEHIERLSSNIGQPVFVLQGRERVVAAPGLSRRHGGEHQTPQLPSLAEAGDPVLAAIWSGNSEQLNFLGDLLRGKGHIARADGQRYIFLYREIGDPDAAPWIVGTYLSFSVAGIEVRRLWRTLALSLVFLLISILAVFYLGRRMARPVEELAMAARRIQDLDFAAVEPLPRSHVRELDHAAEAFNAMRVALMKFETYVPRRLVRQLMRDPSPEAMASREVEVTVLFTDIVGFTRLAEQLDATEAAALLNGHFELLAGCIAKTDGTIDKYLGDGVMAFWGAPLPQPDHAARAVRAAVCMRERLREALQAGRLRLRIGIHSGPALVGNIGAQERVNFTLIGDTVNIAHRLEQLAKEVAPDEEVAIMLSETTAQAAGPALGTRRIGSFTLRGRSETVEVYTVPEDVSAA